LDLGLVDVGVIGLGWIGEDHLADLAERPEVCVVAVCDADADRAATVGARYGAKSYLHYEELLESHGLDALWVCTPPQHHAGPTVTALERGIPVYLEKPIARTMDDADRICAAAARTGVVCAVGYQWHSLELLDVLRDELAGQRIATLIAQSIGPTAPRPWFLQKAQSGGNLLERGSHQIDLARAIGGAVREIQVVATGVRLSRGVPGGSAQDIDDAMTIILHFDSGATATIAIAWTHEGGPTRYGVDVVAERGTYRLALDPEFTLTGITDGRAVGATAGPAFSRSNTRFLNAVAARDAAAIPCSPDDARSTLAVARAGELALATGKRVRVA
jgi:predicted dehydrogenase